MRNALDKTRVIPVEKMQKIKQMVNLLLTKKSIEKWGMKIDNMPINFTNTVLAAPQCVSNKQIVYCSDDTLRKISINKPVDLTEGDWMLFYAHPSKGGRSNFNAADKVLKNFKDACGRLGIKVEDPEFVELENENDAKGIEEAILNFMMENKDSTFKHPIICVFVLGNEKIYQKIKDIFIHYRIPSQVVTVRNALGFNMSKASNVLK